MGVLDGRRILLATVKENVSLTAIDAASGAIVAVAPVGTKDTEKPHEFALTADGSHAFVTLYGNADYGRNTPSNRLGIVDMATFTCAGHVDLGLYRAPHSITRDRDGYLWVTVEHNCCLIRIDPETREIDRCVWLQVPGHWVTPSPDGATLYCGHKEYPFVSEVDPERAEVTARIALPVGSQAIRVSPDGGLLYAGDFHRPLLHVVDCERRVLIRTVPLAGVPGWPYPTPEGRHVLVTTYDEANDKGFVEIVETSDFANRRVVEVPGEPFHSFMAPTEGHAFVAVGNGTIVTVDVEAGELVGETISTGGVMPEMIVVL